MSIDITYFAYDRYTIISQTECRKVLSKHFTYWSNDKQSISVNIVVTDIDADDMAKRLKE